MVALRRLRAYIAWLALCAMCFGAAAPTVSKWLAATQGVVRVQVCSPAGHEEIAFSTAPEKAPEAPAAAGDACAYCTLAQHSPFIPPVATALPPRAALGSLAYVNVAIDAPHARTERRAHAPRAPPALS